MKKENYFSVPRNLILFGISMMLFSNPVLYLTLGAMMIDIQNLFGASIDRRSVSFETNDPFIQGMQLVGAVGFIVILYGLWMRKKYR